ncbi:glycosyltransferase family 4 protein [Gemmatimonas sp.]|uniref:glycosyltransferase family 4 protein n=1 Tax=Gemmatimonas sp. TaxID=1962908 RepID=UPI0039838C9B
MTPRRFCFVTTFYPPYHFGGDGVFVYRLAEALAARGHRVDVIHSIDAYRAKSDAEPPVPFTDHPNVRRIGLRSAHPRWSALQVHQTGRPLPYAEQLEAHFAANQYDVIHYHNVSLMGAPSILRMGKAVKFYTTHEYWLVCPTHVLFKNDREACTTRSCFSCTLHSHRPPQWWRATSQLADSLESVDAVLTPSRFARDRHASDGITKPLTLLPHFVPVPTDDELGASSPPLRPYFLYVGRLERLKGVHDLLTILADYRDADLLIVGSGESAASLRAAARSMPHVHFLDTVHPSALGSYIRQAIALLVPSLCYETFALSAAEAMAYGTPVIGRRIGAVQELLELSGGGLTFETLRQCRGAMERLRLDPDARAAFGNAGRAFAQREWTIEVHLARYEALVESHLASYRPTPP